MVGKRFALKKILDRYAILIPDPCIREMIISDNRPKAFASFFIKITR